MKANLDRIRLFGIDIDRLTKQQAAARLLDWAREDYADGMRFVVTPNVDHTRLLQKSAEFRAAYDDAAMITPDGMPVVWASRLLGRGLPERVTGADLVEELFEQASLGDEKPVTAYLLGAGPGVAERAAENIETRWKGVRIVGTYSPPMGFEKDPAEDARTVELVNQAQPDVLVIGLGAPKQELWAHRHREIVRAKIGFCVGATIDFLAGEKPRAPQWMQRCGLEWLHRVSSEPKRLAKRYAHDAFFFPWLVAKEAFGGNQRPSRKRSPRKLSNSAIS